MCLVRREVVVGKVVVKVEELGVDGIETELSVAQLAKNKLYKLGEVTG